MSGHAVVDVAVIRKGEGPSAIPVPAGTALLHGLAAQYRVVLVLPADEAPADMREWLVKHGLTGPVTAVVRPSNPTDSLGDQWQTLITAMPNLGPIISPDPALIAALVEEGRLCMLWCLPAYARPEWRPDDPRGRAAWDDIVGRLDAMDAAKEADVRVMDEDDVGAGRFE